MAITQYLFKTIKMGAEVTPGTEPTYAVTVPDTEAPAIEVDVSPFKVNLNAGEKGIAYDVKFTIPCLDPIGNASVEALVGTTVWIHGEPDGTIAAGNPALTLKSFILNKSVKYSGNPKSSLSKVIYEGSKTVILESDAVVKDVTA